MKSEKKSIKHKHGNKTHFFQKQKKSKKKLPC